MLDGEVDKDEPLHVFLTADLEEQLEVGASMINAIIAQDESAQKYAIIAYDPNAKKRIWCENCGKQGHKFYECPEKILGNKSKIRCAHCQSTNHPSTDCPEKAKSRHIHNAITSGSVDPKSNQLQQEVDQIIADENELTQFLKDQELAKINKDQIQALTYEAIQQNALKPYEEQRDNLEIMQEHK